MPLFVIEDKLWVSYQPENAQYQRLARYWNQIHRALLKAGADIAILPMKTSAFFRFDDELLICSNFTETNLEDGLSFDQTCSLFDFEGQSEEMLRELADDMEAWLEAPEFINLKDGQKLHNDDLAIRLEHPEFKEKYLYHAD